jgi:hypothetical protein
MDFGIPDEHRALRAAVADVAAGFGNEYYTRKAEAREFTGELWAALGKHGYLGVNIAEEHGGGAVGPRRRDSVPRRQWRIHRVRPDPAVGPGPAAADSPGQPRNDPQLRCQALAWPAPLLLTPVTVHSPSGPHQDRRRERTLATRRELASWTGKAGMRVRPNRASLAETVKRTVNELRPGKMQTALGTIAKRAASV